jgi:hypothetical protein
VNRQIDGFSASEMRSAGIAGETFLTGKVARIALRTRRRCGFNLQVVYPFYIADVRFRWVFRLESNLPSCLSRDSQCNEK